MSLAQCARCHRVGEPDQLKTWRFHGEEVCEECWLEFEQCEMCEGEGITSAGREAWEEYECPECDGEGWIDAENELMNQQAAQAAEDES